MGTATRSNQRNNSPGLNRADRPGEAIAAIGQQRIGLFPGPAMGAGHLGQRIEQRKQHLFVTRVGRAGFHHQRQPGGFRQQMDFAAIFASVYWIGPGVRPPKTARTLAESATARARSTSFKRPRCASNL